MAKFVKGQSGNPTGRPKLDPELKELAKAQTAAAVRTLTEIMKSKKSPANARVAAATALMDRGHGRPVTTTELTGKEGSALFPANNVEGVRRMLFAMSSCEVELGRLGIEMSADSKGELMTALSYRPELLTRFLAHDFIAVLEDLAAARVTAESPSNPEALAQQGSSFTTQ